MVVLLSWASRDSGSHAAAVSALPQHRVKTILKGIGTTHLCTTANIGL